ncbi:major facilitator superfamily transporter [Rhizoctonia solani]|uniref:Major facilitator superfamily transporter n=1 Tax=Rhizoctonia solani TaxID=456999 RepID=A0A8H8T4D1_9AGAM|nr:major facilitator superfamily transporter [Rhizoctonia solani]QRW27582.1 major facilitator superfamily transporter [Rhizoctonia solani]
MTGVPAAPENAVDTEDTDVPVKEDIKPTTIPEIPILSQLPSLYIDKQSASISGYTPGSITPGYSGTNTPAAARENYFENAFESSGNIASSHPDTPRLKRRLALSFFGFFCAGWSDGITGTVLPRFEETYHVDYLTVSLLFVASTVGFAIGTAIIEPLFNGLGRFSLAARHRRYFPVFPSHISRVQTGVSLSQGRCGVLFFGGLSQAIYFTIAAAKAPFPAMIIGFGFSGIGISLLSGQYNAFVAAQKSAGRYLGAEDIELEGHGNDSGETTVSGSPHRHSRSRSAGERSAMRMTLTSPIVWIFAIFLCTYTGSETTTGGWIVSFLLKERNADPDTVGYVASGFWGGLAVGRLLLGQMSPYIGLKREKHLVHIYIGVALLMTILVWKVPSFVGNAFCTAIVGFVLGPIFPTSLSLATKLLPTEIHMTALATMSSFASIGSALYPFVTGVLANAKGVAVLQPMMLGILSVMAGLWCFFPTRSIT